MCAEVWQWDGLAPVCFDQPVRGDNNNGGDSKGPKAHRLPRELDFRKELEIASDGVLEKVATHAKLPLDARFSNIHFTVGVLRA